MRKIFIILVMLGIIVGACSDGADRVYEDVSTPWEISMKLNIPTEENFSFQVFRSSYLGANVSEINWGDGKVEKPGTKSVYDHQYDVGNYSVTVKGTGAIMFLLSNNNVVELNLSKCPVLLELQCTKGSFTTLDLNKCSEVTKVVCNAALESLEVAECSNLTSLDCSKNKLKSLSLPSSLSTFICTSNQLETLDLSDCSNLGTITCNKNVLKSLKVVGNVATLTCGDNKLEELVLQDCANLKTISCENNMLDKTAIDALYSALPQRASNSKGSITVYGNLSIGTVSVAEGKYWTVVTEKPEEK